MDVAGPDASSAEITRRRQVRALAHLLYPVSPYRARKGQWLLVSNQEGANLAVFRVDSASGELTAAGDPVSLIRPMGVAFAAN